jgi:hypothetical protein
MAELLAHPVHGQIDYWVVAWGAGCRWLECWDGLTKRRTRSSGGARAYTEPITTLPAWRRRGIASALLVQAMEHFRAAGMTVHDPRGRPALRGDGHIWPPARSERCVSTRSVGRTAAVSGVAVPCQTATRETDGCRPPRRSYYLCSALRRVRTGGRRRAPTVRRSAWMAVGPSQPTGRRRRPSSCHSVADARAPVFQR